MFKQLESLEKRYKEIEKLMSEPEVISDSQRLKRLAKEHSTLKPIVEKYREYKKNQKDLDEIERLLGQKGDDEEFVELLESEKEDLENKNKRLKEELEEFLFQHQEGQDRNIIMEIRAGTGGEEAALFVSDLFRMYSKYAQSKAWKVEVLSSHPTATGGFKELIFSVEGGGVYNRLRYESGTHRVQRVPTTEASGRIHTSAATVAVLPEAEEVDLKIDPNDLKIETFRASGHGGQHVNVTDSAVRITHLPTNTVVSCQDERSQIKNRQKAMKVLRARILEKLEKKKNEEISKFRKSQIGTGDRSQKIRTYNFPQNRVTDHRINLTLYKLNDILEGDLDQIIDCLIKEDRKTKNVY
ncbi:MAG TPA: peptide chain release factor 1 [Candidatus Omnitrophica bacterium]|nr:peptide chain release factor 1 [Candidatus Omnitrophota bacterium]